MHVSVCVCVCFTTINICKRNRKKQRKEPKEKLQNNKKEKNLQLLPVNRRCLSLLANHFGQKLVSKIEKPAKIRFEIRETRNESKHVEKQAKAKLIYKLNIARSLIRSLAFLSVRS